MLELTRNIFDELDRKLKIVMEFKHHFTGIRHSDTKSDELKLKEVDMEIDAVIKILKNMKVDIYQGRYNLNILNQGIDLHQNQPLNQSLDRIS